MSTGAMDSGWYYSKRGGPPGQQVGPITWEDLVSYSRAGALTPDDLVWNQQLGDWRPASQIPGLFATATPAVTPSVAPAGYAAPAAYGLAAQPRKSSLLYWLIPLIAIIVIGAGLAAYFGIWYHKGSSFTQGGGEILLEPSGVAGPDSFAGEQFVAQGPTTTLKIPNPKVTLPTVTTTTAGATTTSQAASTTTAKTALPPTVLVAYPGDTPALYGGSKSKVIADKEGELAFLEQNPNKAAAFCEALNSDPTLRWSGGNKVTPGQLRAYFAELTPMMLTRDIRVTNYGYKNGRPTPRQSVLQAGQLVLVDRYGVPRKRCECGNPLTPPIPSPKPPVYTGPRWPGFDPTTIIVIQQTTVIIDIFVVIDVNTGDPYGRPSGTEGGSDGQSTGGSTETTVTTVPPSTDTTATSIPPTTDTTPTTTGGGPVSAGELEGPWSGTLTVTELNLDPASQQAAQQQGCDLSVLQAIKNMPLPTEMTITMDAGGATGSAVMTIDASSLGGSAGSSTNTPQTFTFTFNGDTLTFTAPAEPGTTSTMTGTVSRQGQTLVLSGVLISGGQGVSMSANWQVTKQIIM
jgi:hypothetical protein